MLEVTFYALPNGKQRKINISNVNQEDADFFNSNELSVSMEELMNGKFVLYSTTGAEDDEGEEIEEIYIVPDGQSCNDALHELVNLTKKYIKQ